ncbi:AAA-5 domain-containing protein [Candidatus Omnitrophus magneticus]|uniref:AAA-5 domain-containing protein n=1 Tax=Candidatus Omnitrophus magneticus TaxID=1609969 RepID=A0A0F0CQ76_9BACT|nr:AAA-5 domain-containing protein [Candidatus Omnitrophus magneticus]
MDKYYDEFHKNTETFVNNHPEYFGDIEIMNLDGMDFRSIFDAEEDNKFMILTGKIHGLYKRTFDGTGTIYVNREEINKYISEFKFLLGEDVTIARILRYLDGHETFHALIDKLRMSGNPISEINEIEEERLADIFGKAFSLRRARVPEELKDELTIAGTLIGINLLEVIEKNPDGIENLLENLGITVDVKTADPEEMEKIVKLGGIEKSLIRKSESAGTSETLKQITTAIENRDFTSALKDMQYLIKSKQTDTDTVTEWIKQVINTGESKNAEQIVKLSIQLNIKNLNLHIIKKWADIIQRVSPDSASEIKKYQKMVLRFLIETKIKIIKQKEAGQQSTIPDTIPDIYICLSSRYPGIMSGMSNENFYNLCLRVIKGEEKIDNLHPKHESFLRNYFERMLGKQVVLTEKEAKLIRTLSMDISRTIQEARRARRLKHVGDLSFRESMRFMKIFSRYYLKDMEESKSRVFEYFTVSAWAVYGRFINAEDRKEFAQILGNVFNRKAYSDLFVEASVSGGKEINVSEILKIFDYGRFENIVVKEKYFQDKNIDFKKISKILQINESLTKESWVIENFGTTSSKLFNILKQEGYTETEIKNIFNILTNSREYLNSCDRKILSAVERARASKMAAFLFIPSGYLPDAVYKALSKEENSEVFPITMSGFTQRKEFFGMNLPGEDGVVKWLSGAINKVSKFAKLNPNKQVYLVLENPDFASGDIRMALHQFLLERKILLEDETDELGKKAGEMFLPDNLQVILTMDETAEIGDESFMDRAAGCHLETVTNTELKEYLISETGIPSECAEYLTDRVFNVIKNNSQVSEKIKLQDIIQIAYYTAGRIKDNDGVINPLEITREESALHLISKFSLTQEKEAVQLLNSIIGNIPKTKVFISPDGKTVNFGGVKLDIAPNSEFGKFITQKTHDNKGKIPEFGESLLEFLGKDYFITSAEEHMFCLLARIYKCTPSKTIFLQGLPGGGKTTIARVFFDIIGSKQEEYTLNKETELNMFRGSLGLSPKGLEMREAEYWRQISESGKGIILNEVDTRMKFLEWMWPVIAGRDSRYGWEFANQDKEDFGKKSFGKGLTHIFTGNIRKDMPNILGANIPATYYMERTEEDIRRITEQKFLSRWNKMPKDLQKRVPRGYAVSKSKILSDVYNIIVKSVRENIFNSKREVTPRQIERFTELLFCAIEKGASSEDAFKQILHIVFVRMWDSRADMNQARDIILTHVSDLPPPLSSSELLDFIKDFSLDIPLLVMTNGTISFEKIRHEVMSKEKPGTPETIIPLSRFHNKKSLIGGINRAPLDKSPMNKLGILPYVILESHLNGDRYFAWFLGYLNLNPQVAPFLNEFFQTNWLSVEEILDDVVIEDVLKQVKERNCYARLIKEFHETTKKTLPDEITTLTNSEKKDFVGFVIGYKPKNLIFRAIGTAEEPISLHSADIDRFFPVNISEEFGHDWINSHVPSGLSMVRDANLRSLALKCAKNAFNLYEKEKEEGLYPHNRLNPAEINLFITEIKKHYAKDDLTEELMKLIAYHTLGIGLTRIDENIEQGIEERNFRTVYLKSIDFDQSIIHYTREFIEENGKVYFVIKAGTSELARHETRYEKVKQLDEFGRYIVTKNGKEIKIRLNAPLKSLLASEASAMIFNSAGLAVSLEGDPGGGKTSGARDISKSTGRPYHEEGMYKWITIGSLLGSMGLRGKEIILNTLDRDTDNRYLLPFLRMYEEGGNFVADEGMVSRGAGHLLKWITEVSRLVEIDLGMYHPGLAGITIKRHPEFSLTITQNDHFKTSGRKPLTWELDTRVGKIRVDNILSTQDSCILIDYYLEGKPVDILIKKKLGNLHCLLSRKHPQKRMVSPRDLIDTIQILKEIPAGSSKETALKLVYSAVSVNYLEGLVDKTERATAETLIKEIFPDFISPEYEDVKLIDRGYSNIPQEETAHLEKSSSYIRKTRAMERMLTAGEKEISEDLPPNRQVLIHEEPGADGIGFLKLFARKTGRKLEIIEGHPFVTAKLLLVNESFEFEPSFDESGHRRAKDSFRQTHGAIRRHLLKEDEIALTPESERVPLLIGISNVDAIPKNELVKLNELIATRSCLIKDETGKLSTYILPPWITIVPVTSNIDGLTSPFANRFRKIGLHAISDVQEIHEILSAQYPNITMDETAFLFQVASLAENFSTNQQFELGYDFNPLGINELALRVQMYKQSDFEQNISRKDPLWYVIRAVNTVLIGAMCPEDREIFIKKGIVPMLSSQLKTLTDGQIERYIKNLLNRIREDSRHIEKRIYEHKISSEEISLGGKILANGMIIHKLGDTLTIITDASAYEFSWNKLAINAEGEKLSEGLSIQIKDNALIVIETLISKVGITNLSQNNENLKRAMPIEEMGSEEFMYPANALIDSMNSLLEAHTPVLTATNKIIRPRIVLFAGETGSGKTTIPKMLTKAEGTAISRVNPWKQMQATKLTVSLSMGETVEMTVSDFLLSCGRINGKRILAGYPTSNRIRILIDEANVTRDVWYVLDAIARGEKKFYVETPAGDALEIELDTEIEITLTYNPAERYGGTGKGSNRYKFPVPLTRKSVKVYTSEPMKEYTDEEMREIMREVYKRGEVYFNREKILNAINTEKLPKEISLDGFFPVNDDLFKIKNIQITPANDLNWLINEIQTNFPARMTEIKQELSEEKKEKILQERAEAYKFDPNELQKAINTFKNISPTLNSTERYIVFLTRIFNQVLKGLALEILQSDKKILDEIITLANEIEPQLGVILGDFIEITSAEKIKVESIKRFLTRLVKISHTHKIYLEGLSYNGGRPFINYNALPIIRTINFDKNVLLEILGEDNFKKVFGDHIPELLVIQRPPDEILGYYDGLDIIISDMNNPEEEFAVAAHELGHYISDNVSKFDKEIKERLFKNIELYSMFFPIILVPDSKKYIKEGIGPRLSSQ